MPLNSNLKPGSFYWAIPAFDPDTDEEWQNQKQPARYAGLDEKGQELWFWPGVDGDRPNGASDWPAIWVGPEIVPDV